MPFVVKQKMVIIKKTLYYQRFLRLPKGSLDIYAKYIY